MGLEYLVVLSLLYHAMHIPIFAVTILLIYLRDSASFNVERKNTAMKYLTAAQNQSQTGAQISSARPAFHGYNLKITNHKELISSSPKLVNLQLGDAETPGSETAIAGTPGEIRKCVIDFKQPDACTSISIRRPHPTILAVDSKDNTVRACAPATVLPCGETQRFPGFCYESEGSDSGWTYLKKTEPKCPERKQKLDIIFVLDGSGSVSLHFHDIIAWTQRMAGKFDVESGINQIGVVQFSGMIGRNPIEFITTEIALGSITSNSRLRRAIGEIKRRGYQTYTAAALLKTLGDFQNAPRWADRDTKKVMVVLTDGVANGNENLDEAAKNVRSQGIIPFAVGVGSFRKRDLQMIATGNDSSDARVLSVGSFRGLESIVTKLSDLIFKSTLEGGSRNMSVASYQLQLSQTGFKITSSRRNGRLYLGAVGAYDWSGTVTKYDTMDDTTADIPTYAEVQKVLPNRTKESYMGYSVTTGTFNDETTEYVATGAPRYKLMGAVVIYKPLNNDNKFNDHVRLMGHPSRRRLGSYFGGSVLALDVNNDNKDDLLVGAPLYVNESYDEGRVFVYVSQTSNTLGEWAKNTYKPIELVGDNLPGGRFGTAIANAGDLNKDGYNDVIIGAPLVEGDRGAVFIYHGSTDGVDPMFKQKILASQLTGVTLKYFGQSLQGAVDLDSNGYPDIAVGAPKSDTVVIFRSRPVVNIAATIGFAGTSAIDIFECILDKKYVNCTTIEVCFTPTGDSIEDQIGMKFNVSMDARKADAEKRLEFRDNNEKTGSAKFTWSSVVALKKSKQSCFTQQVHMKTNVKDYDASVIAEVEYDLTEAHTAVAMSSVRDPTKSNKQSASLNFTKNCVGTCDPDLNVVMTLNVPKYPKDAPPEKDLSKNKKVFVIHSEMAGTPLPVHVNLSNFGENAFDAKVRIKYTDVITLRNVVIRAANPPSNSCVVEDSSPADENGLRTQILRYNSRTNIMPSNTYCYFEFSLIMDPLRNNGSLDNFVVEVEAFISGSTKEKDTSNNRATRTTELDYISDMTLKQGATPDISFNDTTEDTRNITSITEIGNGTENAISTFTVTGNGYSNIPNVGVTLDFPMMTPDNEMLLYLYDVQCKIPNSNRRIACSCDMDQVNRYNLSLSAPQQSTENVSTAITPVSITKRNTPMDTYQYSCLNKNTTGCRTVNCRIKNLGQRDEVIFEAHYRVWTDSLMFNSSNNNEKIELRSNFKITTSQSPNILDENGVRPIVKTEESIINVRLFSANSGPAPVTDNLWIYIVAAIGGLLLLIALVLILWKLGFFKSKYADMKKGAEEDLQEETEFPDENGK